MLMHRRRDRTRIALLSAAGTVVLVLFIAVSGFWLSGGRWLNVRTPSMAETAPVGTLLITVPVGDRALTVGEFIVFHPPTAPAERYAHRIIRIDANGTIHTKGDLNSAEDPWTLHRPDVTSHVIARWWGIGWLLRALPVLVLALALVLAICHFWVRAAARLPIGGLLSSLAVALTLFWTKPLIRGDILVLQSDAAGSRANLVGTGLLPIRAHARGAGSLDLRPGQTGELSTDRPLGAAFKVIIGPHLTWPLIAILVCFCLTPLAVMLAVGVRAREPRGSHRSLTG